MEMDQFEGKMKNILIYLGAVCIVLAGCGGVLSALAKAPLEITLMLFALAVIAACFTGYLMPKKQATE